MMSNNSKHVIRDSAGSGRWFPKDKSDLSAMLEKFIDNAEVAKIDEMIVGALAPHAGYAYSGEVAGYTYRAIQKQAIAGNAPETAVVLGFSHRNSFNGVALMDGDAISTPLGDTRLDKASTAELTDKSELIHMDYMPHNGEWSAENQVPFLQTALPGVPLVMAIIGDHEQKTADALVDALKELNRRRRILVIASSDMLHDPDYELVTRTDRESLKLVGTLKYNDIVSRWSFSRQSFCGLMPLIITMRFAEHLGCNKGILLHYKNSGDDFPESRGQWVVGYGSVIFAK